ncbi:MAG: cytidylate kinase-like family protein [Phycisphaerae bacterium]|nr:cytidylate kinase-like family protein [Phycisphaerae bacterium]MDW8261302.1 cytidylate kinase-like family protein [Phycisphaerales bacterium]
MLNPPIASPQNLRVLLADLQSMRVSGGGQSAPRKARPFVTISRVPGARYTELAQALADRLNQLDRDETPWTVWDRQVLEKVAADRHLSTEVIDSLEESSQSWLVNLFAGLPGHSGSIDPDAVFKSVAHTVTALAQVGRTIIVGYGGVLLTRRLGGVHVCPVAAPEDRVKWLAESERLDLVEAARQLEELDQKRLDFIRRYWPRESLGPAHFTLTVNMSDLSVQTAADIISQLVLMRRS